MSSNRLPIVNDPSNCVDESLDGLVVVHDALAKIPNTKVLVDKKRFARHSSGPSLTSPVAIVTGGGSGHEPFCAGFLGSGMLAASVSGAIFTSPAVKEIVTGINAALSTSSEGVLVIVMNYTGDRLNFGQAVERCKSKGKKVEMFISGDDSAHTSLEGTAGRRGLPASIFLIKIVGALACRGASMDQLLETCQRVSTQYGTLGVAATACIIPGHTQPLFTVDEGVLELGLGVHGEAGVASLKASRASSLVQTILDHMTREDSETGLTLKPGDRVVAMINNLGAMTQMEIHIIAKEVHRILGERQVKVERIFPGMVISSLDMRGFHISLLRITDNPDWLDLLDAPTDAPGWPKPYTLDENFSSNTGQEQLNLERFSQLDTGASQGSSYTISRDTAEKLSRCLTDSLASASDWRELLNDLDKGCGDGDCGSTFEKGAQIIGSSAQALKFMQPVLLLRQLADLVGDAMGGTSGGIYSILLSSFGNKLEELSEGSSGSVSGLQWLEAFRTGLDTVCKYGGARRGDRTLVDALYPAVDAASIQLAEKSAGGCSQFSQVLSSMADAADAGAASTKNMKARAGRASYVREALAMKEDAGARAMALLLRSMADNANKIFN